MNESTSSMVRARALTRVREIACEVLANHDARLYLFGSSMQGKTPRWRDIDVAIDPRQPLPSDLLAKLREVLEESGVPYDVDVIDLSKASPEIRARVEREGLLWNG